MNNFIDPLIGGVIIGIAASLLLLLRGKIFGVTGILDGVLGKISKLNYWRYSVLLGILLGSTLVYRINPQMFAYEIKGNLLEMIIAGLLVGFGTRLGSGCTSGHGICGLARFSPRSMVATLTFIVFGIITVYIRGV